jgi:uncharacterized protein
MADVTARVPVPDVPPPPPGWRRVGPPLVRSTSPRPLFGLGLAIAALAMYSVGQLVPLLVLSVSGSERTLENAFALIAALGQVVGIGMVLGLLRVRRIPIRVIVGVTRPMRRLVLLGLGVGLASVVVNALLGAFVVLITGTQDAPEQALFGDALAGGSRMLLAVVAAGILAPLVEEVLFRGLLYRALRRRQSVALAALLSSLAFAVIHTEIVVSQPLALINLTLLAVLWAILYERTGSLVVPIVAHSVFNLMSIGQVLLLSRFGLLGAQALVGDPLGALP